MCRLAPWVRLRRRADFDPDLHASRIRCIARGLVVLAKGERVDPEAGRLAKRLLRHKDRLFTFPDRPAADWQINFAGRQIRPAVILRKNSQCNRSERGAATQAVLMSVYRKLKLRGHDPHQAIEATLRTSCATGKLPELPLRSPAKATAVANG